METEYPEWLNVWLQFANSWSYTTFRLVSLIVSVPLFIYFWFRAAWAGLRFFINLGDQARLQQFTKSFLVAWVGAFIVGLLGWGLPMFVAMSYQMNECEFEKLVIGIIRQQECILEIN